MHALHVTALVSQGLNLDTDHCEELIGVLDGNGDGWLQYHEFCKLMDVTRRCNVYV